MREGEGTREVEGTNGEENGFLHSLRKKIRRKENRKVRGIRARVS